MRKERVLRGLLAIFFITGLTACLAGCGVNSGARGGTPAYQVPGSNYTGGGSGGSSGDLGRIVKNRLLTACPVLSISAISRQGPRRTRA